MKKLITKLLLPFLCLTFTSCTPKEEKEMKLWHHKLGHLHLRRMKRALSMEAVRRTPRLQIDKRRVCGELKIERLGKKKHVYDVVNKLEE